MSSKLNTLIIIACLLGSCNVKQANRKMQNAVPDNNSVIAYNKTIDKYINYIDANLATFRLIQKNIEGSSAEGGATKLYLNNNDTAKILFIFYGETGKSKYEFYFKKNKLVLFVSQITHYKTPIFVNSNPQIERIIEENAILKDGTVLYLKRNGKAVEKGNWTAKSKRITNLYNELISNWRR